MIFGWSPIIYDRYGSVRFYDHESKFVIAYTRRYTIVLRRQLGRPVIRLQHSSLESLTL